MSTERLFFLPTQREALVAINEQLGEAAWVSRGPDQSATFCVIDSSSASIGQMHAHFLAERRPRRVRVLHLREHAQLRLAEDVAARATHSPTERRRLVSLLLPRGVSYGSGPNLAAIVGQAVGAATLHRRDSDQYRDPDRAEALAVQMELAAIDNRLSHVDGLVVPNDNRWDPASEVAMVGTSVFGTAPIDRQMLVRDVPDVAVDLQMLGRPGVDRQTVSEEANEYLRSEPATRYVEDFFSTDGQRVEMGSCCFSAALSAALPEMPTGIIGCDYMRKDLAWHLGWPVLFHSRKAQHIHDYQRQAGQSSQYVEYAIRDVQYLQIGLIWQLFSELFRKALTISPFSTSLYAEHFRQSSRSRVTEVEQLRHSAYALYRAASEDARVEHPALFRDVADQIKSLGSAIDRGVHRAIADFADLVELWPSVMGAASELTLGAIAEYSRGK